MKINGSGGFVHDTTATERGSAKVTPLRPGPTGAAGSERVSLSDLASKLQSIEAEFAAAEPYDAGRVDEIKQAIRDGRFKVNPEVVADRLIDSLKQLLQPKS